MKTKPGRWGQNNIATLLGLTSTSWSKVLNGQIYPARLQTMQKIEVVFGWPVSEQVQLIPMYWDWPDQASSGRPAGEPTDLRYSIKLGRVVAEWADANPRTVPIHELGLHPDLKPINGHDRAKKPAKEEEPQVEEPQAEEPRPLVVSKPLLKR